MHFSGCRYLERSLRPVTLSQFYATLTPKHQWMAMWCTKPSIQVLPQNFGKKVELLSLDESCVLAHELSAKKPQLIKEQN